MIEQFDVRRADAERVWHPYTQHGADNDALPIVRAAGAYLYDDRGRAIFDGISSWWVTLHGHAHPDIAAAIAEQARTLEQVIFSGFTHEPAARLADALVAVAPRGLSRVFYSDDGSTAVEVAIKIALQHSANRGIPRRRIVAMEHAYHGDTFGAMSASARGVFTAPFSPYLFDVDRIGTADPDDAARDLEMLLGSGVHDIAAVIVEPLLQGAGGMRMWSPQTLAHIRRVTAAADVLLIADEVLTGFGRTGPMFACEHADISPDLICLSKGLTGGFLPMGVTMATEALFESFRSEDRTRSLFHGHSYTANPLACAAALASLELLDAGAAARRAEIERCHREAAARFRVMPDVVNARVLGTVLAFDIDEGSGYLAGIGRRLHRFALDKGVLVRPLGNTVYLLPPYCSTRDDLERAYNVIGEFLETR